MAASSTVPLAQALSVRDSSALDICFAVQEGPIIASSVAKLSVAQAGLLLEALVERLALQPQQAAQLAPWLRSLLLHHGGTLAATPAGQAALSQAHTTLQERTASFSSLLNLAGRLQVLQSHGASNSPDQPAVAKVVFSA